jgi:uncharacterized protein (TIGR02466 family)
MIDIFGIPIYINKILNIKEYENNLINLDYERTGFNNGYISVDKYVLNNEKNLNIKKIVTEHLNNYLYNQLKIKKNIKFKMLNSWCVKHVQNDWAQIHNHDNSFISGILYLKTYENSGNLIFHKNSLLDIFPSSVSIDFEEKNLINSKTISFEPKDGDIIFFPSQLNHSVSYNLNEKDRYCCSFNFYPEGTFGNEKSLNELHI